MFTILHFGHCAADIVEERDNFERSFHSDSESLRWTGLSLFGFSFATWSNSKKQGLVLFVRAQHELATRSRSWIHEL